MSADYDYILVGTGVAATLIAQSILEANPGASILMLEAGKRIRSRDRRGWWDMALDRKKRPYSWTYDHVLNRDPDPESLSLGGTEFLFRESRVRAFGGSTMHWGGWSLRYNEEDFECCKRTRRGADWPIGYSDLEPWYTRAEVELSVSGNQTDEGPPRTGDFPLPPFPWSAHEAELAGAFEAHGLKPGHMPIARFHRCMTTGTCKYCPIGSRYTAQDRLEQMEIDPRHTGLTILTEAPALNLEVNKQKVTGVKHWDPNANEETVSSANTVVICAGAYESPKLLLRSTSTDWPDGVGNRSDQVGRYLVTHTMLRVQGEGPQNPKRWFQEYDFPTLMTRSLDTPAQQRAGKLFLFSNRSLPNIDLAQEMIVGKTRQDVEAALIGTRRAGLDAFIEEFGEFENRIALGKGVGQFRLPKTEVTFTRAKDLEETANEYLDVMGEILKTLGHQIDKRRIYSPRGDHTSGTCRMGHDPAHSVTDKNLKVHEVDNLYVCSNAVLPNAAAVNPTLTLAALSLRLGALLAGPI